MPATRTETANRWRSQQRKQLIMSTETVSQAARPTTGVKPEKKSKGPKPTHRLTRVTDVNGAKSYQEVGALWPHKDGKGFSLKLRAALNPGDNLMVRLATGGAQ
jgi:hypothetical protein